MAADCSAWSGKKAFYSSEGSPCGIESRGNRMQRKEYFKDCISNIHTSHWYQKGGVETMSLSPKFWSATTWLRSQIWGAIISGELFQERKFFPHHQIWRSKVRYASGPCPEEPVQWLCQASTINTWQVLISYMLWAPNKSRLQQFCRRYTVLEQGITLAILG